MNERIKELARQAGAHISTRNLMSSPPQHIETVELWDDRIEKFAELIVKECMKVAAFKDADTNVVGYMAIYRLQGRSTAVQMIKEHFGIQE